MLLFILNENSACSYRSLSHNDEKEPGKEGLRQRFVRKMHRGEFYTYYLEDYYLLSIKVIVQGILPLDAKVQIVI